MERKAFFARLPASTYRKLRKLAKSPVQEDEPGWESEERIGVMFRFSLETHQRLAKIAVKIPSDQQWPTATMCEALTKLIDKATVGDLETRESMHDVVRQLIQNAQL